MGRSLMLHCLSFPWGPYQQCITTVHPPGNISFLQIKRNLWNPQQWRAWGSLWDCVSMQYILEANFIVHCHGKDKWEKKERSLFLSFVICPSLFFCLTLPFFSQLYTTLHYLLFPLHVLSPLRSDLFLPPHSASSSHLSLSVISSPLLLHLPTLSSFLFFHGMKCVAH